jgi:hypothetical protein
VAKDGLPYREITPKTIVAQLAREFEFDKLRETVLAAQQMQNQDPLRRPYVYPYTTFTELELTYDFVGRSSPIRLGSLNEDANVKKLCGIAVTLDYAEAALFDGCRLVQAVNLISRFNCFCSLCQFYVHRIPVPTPGTVPPNPENPISLDFSCTDSLENKCMNMPLSLTLIHPTFVQAPSSNSRFEFLHQVAR